MSQIFVIPCPKCGAENWFNADAAPRFCDVEGGICWKCKHEWIFDPENSDDDGWKEKGVKTPNKAR